MMVPTIVCARVVINDIRMCACNNSRIIAWILMKFNTICHLMLTQNVGIHFPQLGKTNVTV
jgi:hypothetical protein